MNPKDENMVPGSLSGCAERYRGCGQLPGPDLSGIHCLHGCPDGAGQRGGDHRLPDDQRGRAPALSDVRRGYQRRRAISMWRTGRDGSFPATGIRSSGSPIFIWKIWRNSVRGSRTTSSRKFPVGTLCLPGISDSGKRLYHVFEEIPLACGPAAR